MGTLWIHNLVAEVSEFLGKMKIPDYSGAYKYSYSGDLSLDNQVALLGSSVFALKIMYTLGVDNNSDVTNTADYIESFLDRKSYIYDRFVYRKSLRRNLKSSIKTRSFSNLLNRKYKIAESRQAYSSLLLYDRIPKHICRGVVPTTAKGIDKYLGKLNWRYPWDAGSHFSHLMFFYNLLRANKQIDSDTFNSLTDYAIEQVNKYQSEIDGCWYKGKVSVQQKINGAMKVITGLVAVDKNNFSYGEKIIDLCLKSVNDAHACDNFNIIFVLNYASKLLKRSYRQDEIVQFALKRLDMYKNYYYPKYGGFSFNLHKSNTNYYGAEVSRGLDEPDIHGTVLFLWGISIIAQILGIEKKLGFREFKT